MKRIVIKFGGTSVGSIEKIINAAKIAKKRHEEGNQVIVVVSAMAGKTNELIKLSDDISDEFNKRELDVLFFVYSEDARAKNRKSQQSRREEISHQIRRLRHRLLLHKLHY